MQKGHANKPQHSVWYTPSFTTPSLAHNFVTHHLLPHHLSHTALSHTIFHTQLCHRFLSHTTFTHTIVHTKLCHKHHFLCRTPSFTHNFVAHTHTPFFFVKHNLSYIPLCHTQLFTYNLFYFSVLHHLLCLSFLPRPRYNICCSLLEEVDLWGSPVL